MTSQVAPTAMALRSRSRTENLEKMKVDFVLERFVCVDNTFLASMGKHAKSIEWQVRVLGVDEPISVMVHVDKSVAGATKVAVTQKVHVGDASAGTAQEKLVRLYPREGYGPSDKEQAKLREDFVHYWKFRGTLAHLNTPNIFEVKAFDGEASEWYPAILTQQLADGNFTAIVRIPDRISNFPGSYKDVEYPGLQITNIRYAGSHQPLVMLDRYLHLRVPAADPLQAFLSADGNDETPGTTSLVGVLARVTPRAPAKGFYRGDGLLSTSCDAEKQGAVVGAVAGDASFQAPPDTDTTVTAEVSKNRSKVTFACGLEHLKRFLQHEVRAVGSHAPKPMLTAALKKSWSLQVGTCTPHWITVEKKYKNSKIVTLAIDDDVIAQASAEDLECDAHQGQWWYADFQLMGERFVEYLVHEVDQHSNTLDSQCKVRTPLRFTIPCRVSAPRSDDMSCARLTVDGQDFSQLPVVRFDELNAAPAQQQLEISPQALNLQLGLVVPYKVRQQDVSSMASILEESQSASVTQQCTNECVMM